METDLRVGDEVSINEGLEPSLTFVIEGFQQQGTDLLACSAYECIHVDLLRKVHTVPIQDASD